MLKKGHDVRVGRRRFGKDITRLILTQIIIEDAKTPDSTFPLDLLRQMIITSGRASQETALALHEDDAGHFTRTRTGRCRQL